jgi:hypothetical protein
MRKPQEKFLHLKSIPRPAPRQRNALLLYEVELPVWDGGFHQSFRGKLKSPLLELMKAHTEQSNTDTTVKQTGRAIGGGSISQAYLIITTILLTFTDVIAQFLSPAQT